MSDNYLDQTQRRAQLLLGKELSPDEMATNFATRGIVERADILASIDNELNDGSELSLSQAAKMLDYVGTLRSTHEALRKAQR